MATKNAVVHSDYTVDNDGPFRETNPEEDEPVAASTFQLSVYTVATQPAGAAGQLAYFSDGNAGEPCLGVYTAGGTWLRVALGDEIDATPPE